MRVIVASMRNYILSPSTFSAREMPSPDFNLVREKAKSLAATIKKSLDYGEIQEIPASRVLLSIAESDVPKLIQDDLATVSEAENSIAFRLSNLASVLDLPPPVFKQDPHIVAALAEIEVFAPNEVAIVHVMNRVVRRCFLFGDDPISGKNFDHRKLWIEDQLRIQAACFGIGLLGFALMSNHFHLILRSRPDCVAEWTDTEVARRWLVLCPVRRSENGLAEEPNQVKLDLIQNHPQKLTTIRSRLTSTNIAR